MKSLHNIERSAFHRGDYVGHAGELVYRIVNHGKFGWHAYTSCYSTEFKSITAGTLREVSEKLDHIAKVIGR